MFREIIKEIISRDEIGLKRNIDKLVPNCCIEKYLAHAIVYDNIVAIALLNQVIRQHNIIFTKEELLGDIYIYITDIYENYISLEGEYPNFIPYRKLDSNIYMAEFINSHLL